MLTRALLAVAAVLLTVAPATAATFPDPPAPATLPSVGGTLFNPHVAISPAGEAVAIWNSAAGDDVEGAFRPPGGAWTAMPFVGENLGASSDRMDVAMDAAGNATAAWRDTAGTYAAYRPAGAAAFGPPVTVGTGAIDELTLAVGADGSAVVAWVTTTGDRVQAAFRQAGATTFYDGPDGGSVPDTVAVSQAVNSTRSSVDSAITSDGKSIVVWKHLADKDVENGIRGPGSAMFAAGDADNLAATDDVNALRLATDGLGGAMVNFIRTDGAEFTLVSRRLAPGGGVGDWAAPETVSAIYTSTFDHVLRLAADGSAYTVFTPPTTGELLTKRRPAGQGWGPAGSGDVVEAGASDYPDLAVGPAGEVLASWRDGGDASIRARSIGPLNPGTAFPLSDASDGAANVELAMDADGDAVAVWRDFSPPERIRAAIGDNNPPALTLTAPATLQPGESGAFAATATDFSGIAGVPQIAFGDGSAAVDAPAEHAYAAPGTYTVAALARDGTGKVTTQTATLVVPAPNAGPPCCTILPPGGGRTTQPDSNIVSPGRRVRARRLKAIRGTASDEVGLKFVQLSVMRLRGGARFDATASAKRCLSLRPTGRVRRQKGRCFARTFLRATGTTTWKLTLKRRLPRGRYVAVSRAVAADGTVEVGFSAADLNLVRFRVIR